MRGAVAIAIFSCLLAATTVAGCGGGGGSGESSTSASRPAERTAPHAPPLARSSSKPAQTHRPPAPRCRPSELIVSHEGGGAGAGSTYYTRFSVGNLSKHACSYSGFPMLHGTDARGRQIGDAAHTGVVLGETGRQAVTIRAEGTASFRAHWSETSYARGACRPRTVARFRVILPGSRHAHTVPFPFFDRCTNAAADRSFRVGAIEPDPEVPLHGDGPATPPLLREARAGEHLPRCRPAELLVYPGPDSPAGVGLGTSYFRLDVVNLSDRACEISGTPQLVAVDLHGRPIGAPAADGTGIDAGAGRRRIRVARIKGHGSGAFMVSTGSVYNYGPDACHFEMAAGLRVRLPGSRRPQIVPYLLRRCPQRFTGGGSQLSVGRVE
jgi:Protein of unknown function (DUF4232)